jgi:K+-transporting ATPase ATPase C chain
MMIQQLRPALVLLLLFTLLLGLAYPLAILGIGQTLMPHQANGSLVRDQGRIMGSELIGQSFAAPGYFHGRPSAAGAGYDASASSGSNLGPASRALIERTGQAAWERRAEGIRGALPADLVTASASGLDPDLSPEAALVQVDRVAKASGLSAAQVRSLVEASVDAPWFGIVGERRVNVLRLNRQVDRMRPQSAR